MKIWVRHPASVVCTKQIGKQTCVSTHGTPLPVEGTCKHALTHTLSHTYIPYRRATISRPKFPAIGWVQGIAHPSQWEISPLRTPKSRKTRTYNEHAQTHLIEVPQWGVELFEGSRQIWRDGLQQRSRICMQSCMEMSLCECAFECEIIRV